jgi:hypothetical protein
MSWEYTEKFQDVTVGKLRQKLCYKTGFSEEDLEALC